MRGSVAHLLPLQLNQEGLLEHAALIISPGVHHFGRRRRLVEIALPSYRRDVQRLRPFSAGEARIVGIGRERHDVTEALLFHGFDSADNLHSCIAYSMIVSCCYWLRQLVAGTSGLSLDAAHDTQSDAAVPHTHCTHRAVTISKTRWRETCSMSAFEPC